MAVGNLGTNANNSLYGVRFNAAGASTTGNTLSAADLAAINASIVGDGSFAGVTYRGISGASGILATGTTNGNTTLNTLVSTGGGPLVAIQIGALVLGVGIPPGTFVIAKPTSTSVTLSQAATGSASGVNIGFIQPARGEGTFSFNGQLELPGGRGVIIVRPGDVVAIDNTGWPILVSAASLAYAGTLWTRTSIT